MPSKMALVVLGCRVLPDGTPSPALARRLAHALSVYRAEDVRHVVVSGGKTWSGRKECDVMAEVLGVGGVLPERLVRESRSTNTRDNARFSTELLLQLDFTRLGLVTCDYHMPRALAEFGHYGWLPEPHLVQTPPLVGVRARWRQARESAATWQALHRFC